MCQKIFWWCKILNCFIFQQQGKERRGPVEGSGATLPVGEYDESKRQKLYDERHNEYLQLQQQVTINKTIWFWK